MPDSTDLSDAKIEETNLQLNDGLETCRSVVNDYRALILGVGNAAAANDAERKGRRSRKAATPSE
jgi:hypothetical protein